jgi:hypothetical protein
MITDRRGRDALLAVSLFSLGILTRLPFRSRILYHWDSVNFALALEHFDVRIHQPQPPGYILYILLGRAFNLLFNDPNNSLVWISILFSGLSVAAIFWLGLALFGRQVGLVSAGLALTSPLLWFYGEVALSYVVEAFFVTVIAFCCYRQLAGDRRYALFASLALGIAGGFRQNTLVLLLPLWLFSVLHLKWRERIAAAALLVLVVVAWLATMFHLGGGIDNYYQALSSQSRGNLTISAAGAGSSPARNAVRLITYGFYALTLGLPLLSVGLARVVHRWRECIRAFEWQVLAVWLLPSLVFYAFFVQQAGYVFTFLPAALLVLSYIVVKVIPRVAFRWENSRQWSHACIVLIILSNVVFFFSAPPFLLGQKKQLFNTPSWSSIRTRNITVGEKLDYIRAHFSPDDTVVLAHQFDFRLPDYYLCDYRYPSLSHQITADTDIVVLEDDVRVVVLFNEDIEVNSDHQYLSVELLDCGESLRWLERSEGQEFAISISGVSMVDKDAR